MTATGTGGVSPAGDLVFRIATGTFSLPASVRGAPSFDVRLRTGPGLQVLLELLDPDGRLRLQVIRYRGGLSPASVLSVRAEETSLDARPGPLPPDGWRWRAAVRNVSSLGEEGPRDIPWSFEAVPHDPSAPDRQPAAGSLARAFPAPVPPRFLRFRGEGWVAGDLHQHSTLSDGATPPDRLLEANLAAGHAFAALADHQILQPHRRAGGLAVIGGVEVTSPLGHFLRLGPLPADGLLPDAPGAAFADAADLERLRARFRREGAVLVLCHPCFPPWHWRAGPLSEAATPFDALEVLCDPTHPGAADAAEGALALWTSELERGVRLAGVGGSDFHGPAEGKHAADGAARPGDPTTFLRAPGPTLPHEDVLSALRRGRAAAGRGFLPCLAASALESPDAFPGDVLALPGPSAAALSVRVAALPAPSRTPEHQGELVGSGGSRLRFRLPGDGTPVDLTLPLPDRPEGWLRLDVRDAAGRLAGFADPIYWTRKEARP